MKDFFHHFVLAQIRFILTLMQICKENIRKWTLGEQHLNSSVLPTRLSSNYRHLHVINLNKVSECDSIISASCTALAPEDAGRVSSQITSFKPAIVRPPTKAPLKLMALFVPIFT